jgi:hypothetical protein
VAADVLVMQGPVVVGVSKPFMVIVAPTLVDASNMPVHVPVMLSVPANRSTERMLDTEFVMLPVTLTVPIPFIPIKIFAILPLLKFPIQFNIPLPLKFNGNPLATVSSQLAATVAVLPALRFGVEITLVPVAPWIIPFALVQFRLNPL